ncbi:MAG: hypothetical protein NZ608_02105, partial [candidate division WOR-3 bacterium]|nr:hypothetical protein [candidate division WOR-3 bacterium]
GIFNFEGEFIGFLGKLSKYMEDLKIGYSGNLESFVRFYKENYYLTDRVSGKIYKYDKNFNLLDSIDVFEINLSIPQVDYTKEPLKYILEAVRNNFFRYIIDFFIDDDICYVLLKEHGFPFLYEINRKNNEIRKTLLPTKVGKEGKINYYFLNKINKEVSIIAILEDADKTFYCEVKVIK